MTKASELRKLLDEEPSDQALRLALSDLYEDEGDLDEAQRHRAVHALTGAGTYEEGALLYANLFQDCVVERRDYPHIAACLAHLDLGDYLLWRANDGPLNGDELQGTFLKGWAVCSSLIFRRPSNMPPDGDWLGDTYHDANGSRSHVWFRKWPQQMAWEHCLTHRKAPYVLYWAAARNWTLVLATYPDGSALFLVKK